MSYETVNMAWRKSSCAAAYVIFFTPIDSKRKTNSFSISYLGVNVVVVDVDVVVVVVDVIVVDVIVADVVNVVVVAESATDGCPFFAER